MLPNPISPYAVAKLAGEHYCASFTRVYGLETVVLRYFNVFGPYQDPTSHYSGVLAIFCRGCWPASSPRSMATASRAAILLISTTWSTPICWPPRLPAEKVSGQMMNLATGSRITLNETFAILRELTGYSGKTGLRGFARRGYPRLAGRYRAGRGTAGL
jgi:hypothetical protein